MKRQFNKVKKLARIFLQESYKLDRMIEAKYGFHYSDTNDDPIIDTLDYATNSISYEEFVERMEEYKKDLEEGGEFIAQP